MYWNCKEFTECSWHVRTVQQNPVFDIILLNIQDIINNAFLTLKLIRLFDKIIAFNATNTNTSNGYDVGDDDDDDNINSYRISNNLASLVTNVWGERMSLSLGGGERHFPRPRLDRHQGPPANNPMAITLVPLG